MHLSPPPTPGEAGVEFYQGIPSDTAEGSSKMEMMQPWGPWGPQGESVREAELAQGSDHPAGYLPMAEPISKRS